MIGEMKVQPKPKPTTKRRNKENMEKAFNFFDTDQSGSIDANEVKAKLQLQSQDIDDSIWEEIIDEVDQNGDREIDMNEFCLMMKKIVTRPEH